MEDKKAYNPEEIIIGRNAVNEALRSGRAIDRLLVAKGARTGTLVSILAIARERGIPVKEADARKLDALCGGAAHQGVLAQAAAHGYAELDDLFARAAERGEDPFFVIADEIEDPHNLGAIIRTAECAGAHGLILPRRRAVGLSYAVGKAAAGALEYLPVARVGNLASTIDELKKRGVWIYGADMDGSPWCRASLTGPIALVVGSEGRGVGRLIREKCDGILSLPMKGSISSLNASVAAGVLLYEIARQRAGL